MLGIQLTYFWLNTTNCHVIVHGRKHSWISQIWKHLWMFSCTFYLGWNVYIWACLNRKSFLMNYGKEGNSQNFFVDDSWYTVFLCMWKAVCLIGTCYSCVLVGFIEWEGEKKCLHMDTELDYIVSYRNWKY